VLKQDTDYGMELMNNIDASQGWGFKESG